MIKKSSNIQGFDDKDRRNATKILVHLQKNLLFDSFVQSATGLNYETKMVNKKMIPLPYPFSLEEELKKNSELKMSDIEMLREWCDKQQHLPKPSNLHLILFLHSNYYSMEAAKNTIENFFTIRSHVPEFFDNRDPLGSKELRQAFNVV